MWIVVAKTDDDVWTYGPFCSHRLAEDFALYAESKYPAIEYTATEMFEPRSMSIDQDCPEAING